MITISGSVHRSFIISADLLAAFEYYADVRRTLNMLPHISIVQQHDRLKYRMLYSTTELGIYRVRMMCDIQAQMDRESYILRISPVEDIPPLKPEVGIYSLTGYGFFNSESIFTRSKRCSDETEIDYRLNLRAHLPIPFGIRFMPASVLTSIAQSITNWRIDEIVEGFIERSIHAYQPN